MDQSVYLLSQLEICLERVRTLEVELDACGFDFRGVSNEDQEDDSYTSNVSHVQHILEELASGYNTVADLRSNLLPTDAETIADSWLDVAVASKRAGWIESSIRAILNRMDVCSYYKTTDAVRLLGLEKAGEQSSSENSTLQGVDYDLPSSSSYGVEELSTHGIFEATSPDNNSHCPSSPAFVPTEEARELGIKVNSIFLSRGYRLRECQLFLLPFIIDASLTKEDEPRRSRIFSANSFFQHQHAVYEAKQKAAAQNTKGHGDDFDMGELEVLVWVFLFGLAVNERTIVRILGQHDVDVLFEARLLTPSLAMPSMVVGEVQVFPVDISLFIDDSGVTSIEQPRPQDIPINQSSRGYLFMTDWPLESLRLPRNAIMPVGYDTLELLSLVAGAVWQQKDNYFHSEEVSLSESSLLPRFRILDLCCGCGIQGIFALQLVGEMPARIGGASRQLVSSDINERAIHFVTANLALNIVAGETIQIPSTPNDDDQANSLYGSAYVLCGDIYDPLSGSQFTVDHSHSPPATFDWILCNPPFVAVPSPGGGAVRIAPSLYAVGGGVDGMDCLRRILKDVFRFLSSSTYESHRPMILMVTEVPNVEESCFLLQSMLDESERRNARIRVAYVEDDVETVEGYSTERKAEVGMPTAKDGAFATATSSTVLVQMEKDWSSLMLQAGIYNRALVLISIARRGNNEDTMGSITDDGECDLRLHKYSPSVHQLDDNGDAGSTGCPPEAECVDQVDEEDPFLTRQGMAFVRSALLLPRILAKS